MAHALIPVWMSVRVLLVPSLTVVASYVAAVTIVRFDSHISSVHQLINFLKEPSIRLDTST
jgi:hypothetical protein